MSGLVVDNFAGGGGASTGIQAALGRPIDFAINHDPEAIAMHRMNHPDTKHLTTSVWNVNPRALLHGRKMDLGWFSPDCTFHSKARGGKPFRDRDAARRRRGLAWLVPYWAKTARPKVIMLENVEEFADWGPLLEDGSICPRRRGMTFRRWHRMIENLGYQVDMRELRACDFGAPTTRKRLFVIARRDGEEIVFPEATHGPQQGLSPYATAADCIDWSIPCPSIFERSRPLAEATLRRIARGVMRYVVNSADPFIVQVAHGDWGYRDGNRAKPIDQPLGPITAGGIQHALVSPSVISTRNGERLGQAPRVRSIRDPLPTVTAQGSQGALVAAFLAQHNTGMTGHHATDPLSTISSRGSQQQLVTSHLLKMRHHSDGQDVRGPLHTLSAQGQHFGEVRAFLMSYYGTEQAPNIRGPAPTVRTKEHLGLVTVRGQPYQIVDIGMRMLTPRELFRAQSFPDNYVIDTGIDEDGRAQAMTKTAQIRMCGNSVAPAVAEALVRANMAEQTERVAA